MMTKKELKWRDKKGCLTDCVAFVFNLHPMNVPLFVRPEDKWPKKFKKWLKMKGFKVKWIWTKKIPKRGMFIVGGRSLLYKNSDHVVVYRNGKMVYDPSCPSYWNNKRVQYYAKFIKL